MQFDGDQGFVHGAAGAQAYGIALWCERDLGMRKRCITHPDIRRYTAAVCGLPGIWRDLKDQVNRGTELNTALGVAKRQGTNLRYSSNAAGQDEKVAKFHNKFFMAQVF